MTGEEFAQQLQTWKKELAEDVVSHYRAGQPKRGDLAFERWKERFTRFLKEYAPSEAARFEQETRRYGAMIYPGEHPYDTFMREDGNTCFAFIDDLREEAVKGRLADLQAKSSGKLAAGENMPVLTDQTLLKVRNDIRARLSRPHYEDLLIELGIYSISGLRDENGPYMGMTKDQLIDESLLSSDNNRSILKALLERRILTSETRQALIEDGIDLQGMAVAPDSDGAKAKIIARKGLPQHHEDTKNKTVAARRKSKARSRKKVILLLAADPTNTGVRLRLDEEQREIEEKLRSARLRSRFELVVRVAVRPEDVSQALLDVKPDIVHFSGHGTTTGELCFENRRGEIHRISPNALATLFRQFANQVKCVILNACYSKKQANAIAKHIKYVIGTSRSIGDEAAIAFAVGFYQALGAGRTIRGAYNMGCVQIKMHDASESMPVMITKAKVHS